MLEQDYSLLVEDVEDKLEDDAEGRTDLEFSGKTYNKKPIGNTPAELNYEKDGYKYEEVG